MNGSHSSPFQRIDISDGGNADTRFSVAEQESIRLDGVCLRYMGTAGGSWPTPQRGHWFPKPDDVATFRRNIEAFCGSSDNNNSGLTGNQSAEALKQRYRLVLYQRDRSRKLVDEASAIALIKSRLPQASSWDVEVLVHQPDRSPCALARKLRHTDVLVTSHGFQSMLLLFLPRPSVLFEIFPYRYFKRGYGPLSREYGVVHGGVMSPPVREGVVRTLLSMVTTRVCFMYKDCRGIARGDDVRLTPRGADRLAALVRDNFAHLGALNGRRDVLSLN